MQHNYKFNCYELLGINHRATNEEIKKAHIEKLKEFHPDKHNNVLPANLLTQMINEAKEILLDTKKRNEHDLVYAYKERAPQIRTVEKVIYKEKIVEKPVYIEKKSNPWNTILKIGAGAAAAVLIFGLFGGNGKK